MKTSWLILLLLLGCTTVLEKLKLTAPTKKTTEVPSPLSLTCANPPTRSPQLVGTNPKAQRSFTDFLRNHQALNFDFKEKVVLWTLLQINVRPDLVSPTARFQFIIKNKAGSLYYDFMGHEDGSESYPLFQGLDAILKDHPRKKNLLWYAQFLDSQFNAPLIAGKTLEFRLRKMSTELSADETLRRHFFRGDEVLRESERLSKVQFVKLVSGWQKLKKPSPVGGALYPYRKTPKLNVRCNYDFTLYDNSIFLIDKEENIGHLFGMSFEENAFIASISQNSHPRALFGEPVLAGSAKVRSTAFCIIQNENTEIWVTSNQSRDPGQHLYHLFRYGLSKAKTSSDIERLISHARHMFLADPLRLVIESSRSREEQIQELLKLNVPIYNAQHIGNIWAWAKFDKTGQFFIDDRNPGALFCAP